MDGERQNEHQEQSSVCGGSRPQLLNRSTGLGGEVQQSLEGK